MIFEIFFESLGFFFTIFDNFWIFWVFNGSFWIFLGLIFDFCLWIFFLTFWFFWFFFWFLGITYKVIKGNTISYQGYYWKPKMGQNSLKRSFVLPKGQKKNLGQRPRPSAGAGSRPGVARAVLQLPLLLIHSFIQWSLSSWGSVKYLSWLCEKSVIALGGISHMWRLASASNGWWN